MTAREWLLAIILGFVVGLVSGIVAINNDIRSENKR